MKRQLTTWARPTHVAFFRGKFSALMDAHVYGFSLGDGGVDEEKVDAAGIWYGLMLTGSTIFPENDPFLETLARGERTRLLASPGVILYEDEKGYVTVNYYDAGEIEEMNADWAKILARK